jgi:hypothetical protein
MIEAKGIGGMITEITKDAEDHSRGSTALKNTKCNCSYMQACIEIRRVNSLTDWKTKSVEKEWWKLPEIGWQ